jgi:predicted deacylase
MNRQYPISDEISIEDFPENSINYFWLNLTYDGLGQPVQLPIMLARGKHSGKTIGLTAAVHGNELNGISVIQRVFNGLDTSKLSGNIIGIPVVNIPAFEAGVRFFTDGADINRIMPGRLGGNVSEVYAHLFIEKALKKFDYLLDLHTASFGRVNSFYIRSNLSKEIVVHTPPSDGTLRGVAEDLGIPSITIEVGNPNTFQRKIIKSGLEGIHNVLSYLEFYPYEIVENKDETIVCKKSYWLYTDMGGLLTVHVELVDKVEKGTHIATLKNVFGNIIKKYYASEKGVVIGKSISPVNHTGGRIIHLGVE